MNRQPDIETPKLRLLLFALLFITISCKQEKPSPGPWYPEINDSGEPVIAVYESRIPCDDCERLKFALALYGKSKTENPVSYLMARVYVGKNDERIVNKGTLSVGKGTSIDTSHLVYVLTSGAPDGFHNFWKMNDSLIFILDSLFAPKVGDSGQGYVLNRVR